MAQSIYSDLGYVDAAEMESKAQLVRAIQQQLRSPGMSTQSAAALTSMSVETLAGILKGRFRNVSEQELRTLLRNVEAV